MPFPCILPNGWGFPGPKPDRQQRNIRSGRDKDGLLPIVAISLLLSNAFASDEMRLSVDRTTIQAGESCNLTWSTSGTAAFLTNVGKVAASGSVMVFPERTTEFILLTEEHGGISSTSLEVLVSGQKGDSGFPDPDEFGQTGIVAEEDWKSYLDFVDSAWRLLQNKLSFHVRGLTLPKGATSFVLYTDRQIRRDLRSSSDHGIRQRRIAYFLKADASSGVAAGNAKLEVRTLVDFQLSGEAGWHKETNGEIIRTAENDLVGELPLHWNSESQ